MISWCVTVSVNMSGFPLTWKTPGKFLEFYVRPGIFGIISRFTLVITL